MINNQVNFGLNSSEKIILKNLSYQNKGEWILSPVSHEFDKGIIYIILGENGSGKTTLLKILSGIKSDYKGDIIGFGKKYADFQLGFLPKKIAYLSQSLPTPYRCLVSEFLFPYKINSNFYQKCVTKEISRFKVDSFLEREISTLSGGEWRRVQLAKFFADASVRDFSETVSQAESEQWLLRPERKDSLAFPNTQEKPVISSYCACLDEPSTGLDSYFKVLLAQRMFQFHTEHRGVLFVSSHDTEFIGFLSSVASSFVRICYLRYSVFFEIERHFSVEGSH